MNTALTWEIESISLENTLSIATQIGQCLRGGEVIELVSDLGGGKTAFVKGLARGMGSKDTVRSPSFTISNRYSAGKLDLVHYDFYRLESTGIMAEELAEIVEDPKTVVAIEWADIANNAIPDEHILIKILPTGDTSRQIIIEYPDNYKYLIPVNT